MVKLVIFLIFVLSFVTRFYRLSEVPASLYWDEASLGYNAFTIANFGVDEHGRSFPYDYFSAFGDYKPPGYIYITALVVKLLDLSEFAIRLPSALSGVLICLSLMIFIFLLNSLHISKFPSKLPYLVGLISAISPWGLQMSRSAFEANLATFFLLLGVMLFIYNLYKFPKLLFLSAFLLIVPFYTFNSHRVFLPFLIIILFFTFIKRIWLNKSSVIAFITTLSLLLIPLVPHLLSPEGQLRFKEVSWINDVELVVKANERVSESDNFFAKFVNNRRVIYFHSFLKHYFDHIDSKFLYGSGDINPRLSTQNAGIFYLFEGFVFLSGLYSLIRIKSNHKWFLLGWLIIGFLPASLARETPHALRILQIYPVVMMILGLGILKILSATSQINRGFGITLIILLYVFFFTKYSHEYFKHYNHRFSSSWQFGYKELVNKISRLEDKYDQIHITSAYGRPYIYFLLYKNVSPHHFIQTRNAFKDNFGFWHIKSYDKFYFDDSDIKRGRKLYAKIPKDTPINAKIIDMVTNYNGDNIFVIYEE